MRIGDISKGAGYQTRASASLQSRHWCLNVVVKRKGLPMTEKSSSQQLIVNTRK
jgi:hypothetical protein